MVSSKDVDNHPNWYYDSSMKCKTSITLSSDLMRILDQQAAKNRSEFIEKALRAYIAQKVRDERNARDVRIIDERAVALNKEALDVLDYQVKL